MTKHERVLLVVTLVVIAVTVLAIVYLDRAGRQTTKVEETR
jgi:hypothetical protein